MLISAAAFDLAQKTQMVYNFKKAKYIIIIIKKLECDSAAPLPGLLTVQV